MLRLALNVVLFLYVFGVFIFSKVEGLSLATNVVLLCLLVILAVKGLKTGLVGLKYALVILPLVFVLFLSIFWSRYQVEASISFLSFLTASVGGMAVMLALLNEANPKSVFWAAFLGSSYLVYSAWQERTQLMLSRVAGLAGNANELAITLVIAGILLFINRLSPSRWPKAYALFLLFFSIYMTGSRKTLFVIALIPLFWIIQLAGKRLSKKSIRNAVLFIGAFGVFLSFAGPWVWSSFTETATFKRAVGGAEGVDNSSKIRTAMIDDGLNLWKEKPLLGYGVNQYRFESVYDTYSHNNYVELLASGGLLALISYYGLFVFLFFKGQKTQGQARAILSFSLILLLVWDVALVSYSGKHIWLLIGLCGWLSLGKLPERDVSIPHSPLREFRRGIFRAQAMGRKDVA